MALMPAALNGPWVAPCPSRLAAAVHCALQNEGRHSSAGAGAEPDRGKPRGNRHGTSRRWLRGACCRILAAERLVLNFLCMKIFLIQDVFEYFVQLVLFAKMDCAKSCFFCCSSSCCWSLMHLRV